MDQAHGSSDEGHQVTAREVLGGMKARLSAAADMGVWSAKHPPGGDSWIAIEKPNGFTNVTAIVAKGIDKADAEFIAAAPTDVARLTAAVEAVLDVGKYDFPINSHTEGYNEALDDVRAAIETALKESQ
jgi:hypothetical protein